MELLKILIFMMMGVRKIKKPLVSPCKKDCPNRCSNCKLNCLKWKIYETLYNYTDNKNKALLEYKDLNYISKEEKFKEWVKEQKNDSRNASNYLG